MTTCMEWLRDCGAFASPSEVYGYIASALVLATFSMTSIRRLRYVAIASNLAFIYYAVVANLHPVLILHSILLPLNLYRLMQIEMTTPAHGQLRPNRQTEATADMPMRQGATH